MDTDEAPLGCGETDTGSRRTGGSKTSISDDYFVVANKVDYGEVINNSIMEWERNVELEEIYQKSYYIY